MQEERIEVQRGSGTLAVQMPGGRNRWLVGLGFGLGVPWLVVFVLGSLAAPFLAPQELRREALLGAIIVNLLFALVHILAVAGIWLAFYNTNGSETLVVTPQKITVRRRAVGVTVPIGLGRERGAVVSMLDTSIAPGKGPHPRLEVRAGKSAVRFGAGLTADEAKSVRETVTSVLEAGETR